MAKKKGSFPVENGSFCGSKLGGDSPKLTPTQKDILHKLTRDFMTPKQISIVRNCSVRAVNKQIQKLKEMGIINRWFQEVPKIRGTQEPSSSGNIRLHGQEFNIKIRGKDHRYDTTRKKSNVIYVDGNRIHLYRNSLEIYSYQMFYGESAHSATIKSFNYWDRFFRRLESELNVILLKDKYQNIKLVKHHYAEVENELAQDMNIQKDRIRIFAREDGKLWFEIDNSFHLNEAEFTHSDTAEQDTDNIVSHFNDLRNNEYIPLSEVSKHIADLTKFVSVLGGTVQALGQTVNSNSQILNSILQILETQMPKKQEYPITKEKRPDYLG